MSALRICETCGKPLVRHRKHSAAQWAAKRFCDRSCAAQRLVTNRPCACGCRQQTVVGRKYVKGHRPLKPNTQGYRRIWVGKDHPLASTDGNALEHRVVLFNASIAIPQGYHVHHRNGDKLDNRLENLALVTASEHTRLHLRADGFVRNQFGQFPLRTTA